VSYHQDAPTRKSRRLAKKKAIGGIGILIAFKPIPDKNKTI